MKISFKKLHFDAQIPKYANPGDSGFDFYALENCIVGLGETKLVKTGLSMALEPGFELQVRPRSGLSLKTPLRVSNSPGTVDNSFRGEICVIMTNISDPGDWFGNGRHGNDYHIQKGDRIAQGVVCAVNQAEIEEVESLDSTERGTGGFGSSGQ